MSIDYNYLSKKPLLCLNDLLDLFFKMPLQKAGYPSPEHERIAKVQRKFLQLIYDSLIAGTLTAVNDDWKNTRPQVWAFVTKKEIICSWISEKKILDWLNDEGIKVSNETVKLINSYQHKIKRKTPHPDTDRGRMGYFKKNEFIPLVEQLLKKNPEWQNHQILSHKKVDDALDMCGFLPGTPSKVTLEKWIKMARDNVGAKAKKGRPAK